jgi:hypothetical protein
MKQALMLCKMSRQPTFAWDLTELEIAMILSSDDLLCLQLLNMNIYVCGYSDIK